MLSTIIAFALAHVAVLAVVAASLIYGRSELSRTAARLSDSCSATRATSTTLFAQLRTRIEKLENSVHTTSNAHLAVELAALGADLERLAASSRKNFGRVWAELHHDGVLERNVEKQTVETPEETRARLRLQHGLPKLGAVARSNGETE